MSKEFDFEKTNKQKKKLLLIFRRKRNVTAKPMPVSLDFHTRKVSFCLSFEGLCAGGNETAQALIKHDLTFKELSTGWRK